MPLVTATGRRLALGLVFFAASASRADLIIVQQTEGGGQSGEQTILIKGDKARTDLSAQVSVITDGATGEIVTLAHPQKSFLKTTAAQSKAMMDQLQKMRASSEPPKLQATGKKEKIAGFDCEIFNCNLGAIAITYWLAKDFPDYKAVLAQMQKMQAGAIVANAKGVLPDLQDFPGMPIKTEMDLGGKKIATTLVSAKEGAVDPASFTIPPDYKEITAPAMSLTPAK